MKRFALVAVVLLLASPFLLYIASSPAAAVTVPSVKVVLGNSYFSGIGNWGSQCGVNGEGAGYAKTFGGVPFDFTGQTITDGMLVLYEFIDTSGGTGTTVTSVYLQNYNNFGFPGLQWLMSPWPSAVQKNLAGPLARNTQVDVWYYMFGAGVFTIPRKNIDVCVAASDNNFGNINTAFAMMFIQNVPQNPANLIGIATSGDATPAAPNVNPLFSSTKQVLSLGFLTIDVGIEALGLASPVTPSPLQTNVANACLAFAGGGNCNTFSSLDTEVFTTSPSGTSYTVAVQAAPPNDMAWVMETLGIAFANIPLPGPGPQPGGSTSFQQYVSTTTLLPICTSVTLVDNRSQAAGAVLYTWDFGDGSGDATTSHSVTHNYPGPGDYDASVAVQDTGGGISTYKVLVSVSGGGACSIGEFVVNYAPVVVGTFAVAGVVADFTFVRSRRWNSKLFMGATAIAVLALFLIIGYVLPLLVVQLWFLVSTAVSGAVLVLMWRFGLRWPKLTEVLLFYFLLGFIVTALLFFHV